MVLSNLPKVLENVTRPIPAPVGKPPKPPKAPKVPKPRKPRTTRKKKVTP